MLTKTVLRMGVQRQVFASAGAGGQVYVFTSVNGRIRQGFPGYGRNVFVTLEGGLQNNSYSQGTGGDASAGGEDNYFYIRFSTDWAFRERCLFGWYYEYSDESPGRPNAIGFKRNRVGMQVSMIFF